MGAGVGPYLQQCKCRRPGQGGLLDFTTVSSDIYTELEQHYDQVFAEWANVEVEEEEEVSK